MSEEKIEFEKSSGNVFADLGLPNPEERLAKARLASMIYDIFEERGLTQVEAARILGISQPKVSALRNGRLAGFSLERLFSFLRRLDRDIEIVVREKPKDRPTAEISISAAL
jgi:predicted XRE-type DNA-binding protein